MDRSGDRDRANQLTGAAASGDLEMVGRLLESGADPNATNAFGRSPIQVMMMGSSKMAELLLQRGADPNRPDPSTGATPAHDVAQGGFLDTLKILYQWGARFDQVDKWGRCPLDLAKESGQNHVVDYLQELSGRSPPRVLASRPPAEDLALAAGMGGRVKCLVRCARRKKLPRFLKSVLLKIIGDVVRSRPLPHSLVLVVRNRRSSALRPRQTEPRPLDSSVVAPADDSPRSGGISATCSLPQPGALHKMRLESPGGGPAWKWKHRSPSTLGRLNAPSRDQDRARSDYPLPGMEMARALNSDGKKSSAFLGGAFERVGREGCCADLPEPLVGLGPSEAAEDDAGSALPPTAADSSSAARPGHPEEAFPRPDLKRFPLSLLLQQRLKHTRCKGRPFLSRIALFWKEALCFTMLKNLSKCPQLTSAHRHPQSEGHFNCRLKLQTMVLADPQRSHLASSRLACPRFDKVVMKLGNPKVAELLLHRGANPNLPDPSTGSLPVHDAAREGFLDTLQVLLSGGARLDLPDHSGRLPLQVAAENGQSHVVRFLARRQSDDA
ncbi:uncharacterized protein PHA67_006669 [Liasis olivaceus]